MWEPYMVFYRSVTGSRVSFSVYWTLLAMKHSRFTHALKKILLPLPKLALGSRLVVYRVSLCSMLAGTDWRAWRKHRHPAETRGVETRRVRPQPTKPGECRTLFISDQWGHSYIQSVRFERVESRLDQIAFRNLTDTASCIVSAHQCTCTACCMLSRCRSLVDCSSTTVSPVDSPAICNWKRCGLFESCANVETSEVKHLFPRLRGLQVT